MSEPFSLWWLALALLLVLAFLSYRWLHRPEAKPLLPPRPEVELLTREEPQRFRCEFAYPFILPPDWEAQSHPWQSRMLKVGHRLREAEVKRILFLHGSFTGNDPFNLLPPLRAFFPNQFAKWEDRLTQKTQKAIDKLAQDTGNFLPAYLQILESACLQAIPCERLQWSSANHHWARLQGALVLVERLFAIPKQEPGDRLLIIGHSHARQVFALASHLLSESKLGLELWQILKESQDPLHGLQQKAREWQGPALDFVCLGGPLRYAFAQLPGLRLLQIVNHRGDSWFATQPWMPWNTAGGDYIQQWGGAGSDTLATTTAERQANRQLDRLLGKGIDATLWRDAVQKGQRVADEGLTLLVDFQDQGRLKPNGLLTIFGHGVYTRFKVMLPIFEMVTRHYYPEKSAHP